MVSRFRSGRGTRARLHDHTDLLFAGEFSAALAPGDSLTIVASTSAAPSINGEAALAARHREMDALLERFFAGNMGVAPAAPPAISNSSSLPTIHCRPAA